MPPHGPEETNESRRLHASVRALAGGAASLTDERLLAVQRLACAPAHPSWERGLLLGLHDPEESVQKACRDACAKRLVWLEAWPEQQDAFLGRLLAACFAPHRAALSGGYAALLHVIADALLERPLRYEHHRSRLLLHVTRPHIGLAHPPFALALSQVLQRFADESSRSDSAVVRALQETQRLRTYHQPGAPPEVLLLYLEADRCLAPAQVQIELLQAYAALLAHAADQPAVVAQLCGNLCGWLAERPSLSNLSRMLLYDALKAAGGRAWTLLPAPLRLQLEVAAALCAGPDTPGDLVAVLRERSTLCDDEALALHTLRVLARLPVLRTRLPELCAYLRDQLLGQRSPAFWSAALDLAAALLTGLDSRPVAVGIEPWLQRLLHLQRPRWHVGERDQELRALLRDLSASAMLPRDLRLRAWRMLLEAAPHDRAELQQLYAEGCAGVDGERLEVSLEAAAQTCRRSVWRQVERLWDGLTAGGAETPGRRARLALVCRLFEATRQPAAVERRSGRAAPMIGLALDDPDLQVRLLARQAIVEAELPSALEAEEQMRTLGEREQALGQLDEQRRALEVERDTNYQTLLQTERRVQELERQRQNLERERQRIEEDSTRDIQQREALLRKVVAASREADQKLHEQHIQIDIIQAECKRVAEAIAAREADRLEIERQMAVLKGEITERLWHRKNLIAIETDLARELGAESDEMILQEIWGKQIRVRQELADCGEELRHMRERWQLKSQALSAMGAQLGGLEQEQVQLQRLHRTHRQTYRQLAEQKSVQQQRQLSDEAQLDEARARLRHQIADHEQRLRACAEHLSEARGAQARAEREQSRLAHALGRNEDERRRFSAEAQAARERVLVLLRRASAEIGAADAAAAEQQERLEQQIWTQQELFVLCMGCLELALRRVAPAAHTG